MDNENKVMEPETTPEEANSEENRDGETAEVREPSSGLTLKKVAIIAGTVLAGTWVCKKIAPHVKKWLRDTAAAYVENYDSEHAEDAEEVVCEPYSEEVQD